MCQPTRRGGAAAQRGSSARQAAVPNDDAQAGNEQLVRWQGEHLSWGREKVLAARESVGGERKCWRRGKSVKVLQKRGGSVY